jgi:NDP-sugar pyrophosphorylase family protein
VCGKPLLLHQLELLCAHGFTDAVVMVNHRADAIQEWLVGVDLPISVRLIDDGEPRGTAGAVLAALGELEPEFLVMYGDTMLAVDLTRFWAWHHAGPGGDVSLFLHPNDHPHDSDLVEIDESGRILAFHAYPHPADAWLPNLVNAALYVVRRERPFSAHAGGRSNAARLRLARIHQGRGHARTTATGSQRADVRRHPSRFAQ